MRDSDVIIVGAGLAGLVAACELIERGRKVILVDQEGENSLGGQAFWSLGGLFMIDTPEQRRMGIRDSHELASLDWFGSAQFDRKEDHWPKKWAEAYLDFAAGDMRTWLHGLGLRWFPAVGWAERGGDLAHRHGNSVPRFHLTWGTGPGVLKPFEEPVRAAEREGKVELKFRHKVTDLIVENGAVKGVRGDLLAPDPAGRGERSNRNSKGKFELLSEAVIVASGGIGGNHKLVKKVWPKKRLGPAPANMLCGVPHHVDGLMQGVAQKAGAAVINADRMWHYTEGVRNWDPIWPNHAIRVLSGPSSMWFDANGNRFAAPFLPGFDTLGTLKAILATGHDYSWFVLTQKIIEKEFALSGSEQNEDFTSGSWRLLLKDRLAKGAPKAVEAFKRHGADFIVETDFSRMVQRMNALAGNDLLDAGQLKSQIEARDRQLDNPFAKDAQIVAIHGSRRYRGDRLLRTAKPHRILDPAAGPLIAVKLNIMTRKSLGGLHTDLNSQALDENGAPIAGLYAAGEVAGFGGGGYHGYNALEGTFLGGCLFSGLKAGRNA